MQPGMQSGFLATSTVAGAMAASYFRKDKESKKTDEDREKDRKFFQIELQQQKVAEVSDKPKGAQKSFMA